ncbi:MAG: ATP-binding protein [Nanoarchaeota archaeon]|nr:ATP-binding protein [Nanoarchaeota archaeon]
MNRKSLIEREVSKLKSESKGRVYNTILSDLVMVQMAGDFDAFLESLPSEENPGSEKPFARANEIIKETRKKVTTKNLFPSIVEKTIEAQFGDKHAALRELGQNSRDAYECFEKDKPILFDVSKEDNYMVLKVRDYGSGMSLKDVVKDLLIPYNSGKEFDLTKIGEHGIGWYSIVDLAELVKVVTKPRGSEKAT